MVASYIKITLRFLAKNKAYSFINIAGLTLGLSCAMLMILYIKDELSFDKFHKDVWSHYIIAIEVQNADGSSFDKMALTGILQGPRFKDNLPEIESFVRLSSTYRDIKLGEGVNSQKILEADSNFFSFFDFPLIHGDSKTALQNIHSVVISEDVAIRHFGTDNAIDKTILFASEGGFIPYTVTGVSKRCPQNSSIQFEAVIPIQEIKTPTDWVNAYLATLVKVTPGSDIKFVSAKMQKVFENESKEAMEQVRSYGFTQSFQHKLLPFADIHLNQDFQALGGLTNASDPIYSYILSGIAAFILVIACINFINLSIARSVKRAKEIGIRKVVGGARLQLLGQFLGESFLLCIVSFIAAMLFAGLLLPVFNNLVNKELSLSYLADVKLISIYLSILFLTGLLAGFYPAIVLSGYHPTQILYSRFRLVGKNYRQRALIVFQFALATFMIISTITIYLQFEYLTTKDLGYEPDNVMKVTKRGLTPREAKMFNEELVKNSSILATSPQRHGIMNGKVNGDTIINFTYEAIGENFIDLFKIPVAQGRNFSQANTSDSANTVVINEAFAKKAGWREPIGQEVEMMDGTKKRVIGVVKDYNYESLKKLIEPQLFSLGFDPSDPTYEHLLIRIQPNSESTSISHIEQVFKKLFPMHPYSFQFYSDANLLSYQAEAKWKIVILISAFLTIFIAGIGLFGLSILTAESKFKEIGIRKVLGASVNTIVVAIYKEHLLLIALALLIAIPAAHYAATKWLGNYYYRIELGVGIFFAAGFLVTLIAVATVSYQTIRTALLNPVDTLRTE